MAMKIYDVCSKITKSNDKAKLLPIGVLFINKDSKTGKVSRSLKLNILPETNFYIFERKEKQQKEEIEVDNL
jgi:hypothetical protein